MTEASIADGDGAGVAGDDKTVIDGGAVGTNTTNATTEDVYAGFWMVGNKSGY